MKNPLCCLFTIALLFSACHTKDERPNIIIIKSDDMGYSDLACYGGEIRTPSLDALASNGLRFTQFYNTGRCCSTRASLLTGLYAHQASIGHMTNIEDNLPGFRGDLGFDCLTIAEVLREAEYSCYMAGKWHVAWVEQGEAMIQSKKHNWPMHAPEDEIDQYSGAYDQGYGPIRDQRYKRMLELGVINPGAKMSDQVGNWDQLENPDWEKRCMETYAAIRKGDWKLVGQKVMARDSTLTDQWELYNILTDRSELNDLSSEYPDKFEELRALFEEEAPRVRFFPSKYWD